MTRRLVFLFAALTAVAVLNGPALFAHPGHELKVMGTVTMAAADHVMLKDPQSKDHTFQINADTKVLREKKAAKVSDLKAGMRIVVTAVSMDDDDKKFLATVIELGPASATK